MSRVSPRLACLCALLLAGVGQQAQAQSFGSCDARMFLDQTNVGATFSTLYSVGYASTPFTYTALGSGAPRNGMGYNPLDNFIYAIEWGGFSGNELIRIAADGSSTNLGVVAGLPVVNFNNGVISPTGDYYLTSGFGGTNLYRIKIAARTAAAVTMSQSIAVSDLAWHNGLLYGIDSNTGSLVSIDPATGVVTSIGSSPLANAISMWGFTNGLFASGGGPIYAIDPATGAATLMSAAPGSSNADGANCASAAIAFNADLSAARVTLGKISLGGTGAFGFSGSNGIPAQTLTTTVAGTPVSGAVQALTAIGTTTITEGVRPAGYVLTGISCTGLPGGTATPDLATRTVTLDATATVSGADITCTFTNARAAAAAAEIAAQRAGRRVRPVHAEHDRHGQPDDQRHGWHRHRRADAQRGLGRCVACCGQFDKPWDGRLQLAWWSA